MQQRKNDPSHVLYCEHPLLRVIFATSAQSAKIAYLVNACLGGVRLVSAHSPDGGLQDDVRRVRICREVCCPTGTERVSPSIHNKYIQVGLLHTLLLKCHAIFSNQVTACSVNCLANMALSYKCTCRGCHKASYCSNTTVRMHRACPESEHEFPSCQNS